MGKDATLNQNNELIGLIPAAGKSTRISPLPCSKEIFPVGFHGKKQNQSFRPKVACEYLLESMGQAGAESVYVILRDGKWDIPSFLGNGSSFNMNLAYLLMELPFGVPYTLDSAFPFIEGKQVVFGFPDILFQPKDAFVQLMEKHNSSKADIVLGLFPASNPPKMDMVELDDSGNVRGIQIKPSQTDLSYTWIIAVWNFSFTQFMHDFVTIHQKKIPSARITSNNVDFDEIYLGDVIQAALGAGIKIDKVIFNQGFYIDIGTPEDMLSAIQSHSSLCT